MSRDAQHALIRSAPSGACRAAATATAAATSAALLAAGLLSGLAPAAAQAGDVVLQPRMGDPIAGLSATELDRFVKGKAEFDHILSAAEGLGPIFNDTGCGQCHSTPLTGGGSGLFVTRFGKAASGPNGFDPLESLGGSLLQKEAIARAAKEFVPVEADTTAMRITPPIFGAGLVEAIPDAVLLDLQDNPPDPAVSGIAHIVSPLEGGPAKVGRFGWKAQVATMLSFSADASLNEQGLTNALVPTENAPNGNLALLQQYDLVADPEDVQDSEGFFRIERQQDFQRFLSPPPQTPRDGMTGEALFESIGCASCHVGAFTSGATVEPALSGKPLHPYSDFLLHDVGTLGDGIVQGQGTEQEIRTAPLWGLSVRAPIALLHDGRATGGTSEDNLVSAIGSHDGEAAPAREAFLDLSPAERDQVVDFLLSLGQLEFDSERDDDVDAFDWFFIHFNGWFTGPAPAPADVISPDDEAALADVDQDGDCDLVDFGLLQRAMTN